MTLTITNRELSLEVAYNVRHIGGYSTREGRLTSESVVRSAGLHRLTPNGIGSLSDYGIAAIVDLRSSMERERDITPDPTSAGIRHFFAPVFEQDHSPVGMADEFPGYAVVYERMLETGQAAYRTLFEVIAETEGRVLFHCSAGKDRTGVAAALMLGLVGVDAETIAEDYSHSARLLEPLLDEWLPKMAERGVDPERGRKLMASNHEDMLSTLAHIDRLYGGPAGYLESIGISTATMSSVKAKLVA
ncbi:MAG: tyrosine-protein phosphatase [Dehalococcoidia bacterium]